MADTVPGRVRALGAGVVVRRALLVVAAAAAAIVVARNLATVAAVAREVGFPRLGAAGLLCVAATVFAAEGWRVLLFRSGRRSDLLGSWAVSLVSNLGKYVPGALWPVVIQRDFAARHGRSTSQVSIAFLESVLFGVVGAVAVSVLALPSLLSSAPPLAAALVAALAVVAVVFARPTVVGAALPLLGRQLGRVWGPSCASAGRCRRSMVLFGAGWLCSGTAFHLLLAPLAHPGAATLPSSIGGFALGAAVGVLSAVLPGGLGSRELALALVFGSAVAAGDLVPLLVVARVVMTAADLACAGLAGGVQAVLTRRDDYDQVVEEHAPSDTRRLAVDDQ